MCVVSVVSGFGFEVMRWMCSTMLKWMLDSRPVARIATITLHVYSVTTEYLSLYYVNASNWDDISTRCLS